MEAVRENNEHESQTCIEDETVPFSKVATLSKRWMIDFSFVSICHYFKENDVEEFNKTLHTLDKIIESMPHVNIDLAQKKNIAGFLSRVIHGKELDIHFDQNEWTPLMSAIDVWKLLENTVADDCLFENVTNLLYVQSVAVCLEKGQGSMASTVLKWLEDDCEIPRNLRIKLSSIVNKMDTYHAFLLNFSFSRLMDTIQEFLDAFLEQNPSDFLLKAATKVVRLCPDQLDDSEAGEDDVLSQTTSKSISVSEESEKSAVTRPKKKLLSTKNVQPWKPESAKKPVVVLKRISNGSSPVPPKAKTRGKRKWKYDEDQWLKAGVKRFGEGKWSHILLHYDFKGRTGVMLKDRWRTLKKVRSEF